MVFPIGQPRTVRCIKLGLTEYCHALSIQRWWHAQCVAEHANVALLTQHQPVFTLGYRRLRDQIRPSTVQLKAKGLRIVCVGRGGGATYHAPGQLVVYPIFSTLFQECGIRRFVARLEEVMQRICVSFGVCPTRRDEYPGAWVGVRKIGAVGIAVQRRASLHGFALNVNLDLCPFTDIRPCGLAGHMVTSLQQECGTNVPFEAVEQAAIDALASTFDVQTESASDKANPNEKPKLVSSSG